jgi:hypothetical protein
MLAKAKAIDDGAAADQPPREAQKTFSAPSA